ncbi:MAG: hypothetical protein EOM12_19230 [Verrucomicrobiae bacterium]|nr:hypothetical protein [Verrucomicrobiae bacterium]
MKKLLKHILKNTGLMDYTQIIAPARLVTLRHAGKYKATVKPDTYCHAMDRVREGNAISISGKSPFKLAAVARVEPEKRNM